LPVPAQNIQTVQHTLAVKLDFPSAVSAA
jgi:hypothetical protein